MAEPVFTQGQAVRVTATMSNVQGTVMDPGVVTFCHRTPTGTTATHLYGAGGDGLVTKDATGVYHLDIDTQPASGDWAYRVVGTGGLQVATEGGFVVQSNF